MDVFIAFLYAAALSACLNVFYGKVLAPFYHLKYSDKEYRKPAKSEAFLGFLICTLCLWPLCINAAAGGDIWAVPICILLLITAMVDFGYRKIPNELVIIILIISAFLRVYGTIAYDDFSYLLSGISGGIGAVIPLIAAVLIFEKGVGTGDIKLIFAIGVYLGAPLSVHFFFITFLLAFIAAVALLTIKKAGRRSRIVMAPFMALSFVITVYFDYFLLALDFYGRLR